MVQLCLRYTKNDEDATEVLNNAFLKVFQNINRYDSSKASLYTWIRTIVINTCIDFLKKNIHALHHDDLESGTEIIIDAEAISRMNVLKLLSFMRQLPSATQLVFNLYAIEGYNHKEIAQMLAVSEGTSKWHLSEGRKKLQQMILSKEVKHER